MTLVCEQYSGTYPTWPIQYLFFEGEWQKLRLVIDRPNFSGKITVTGGILGSNCSLCFLHQFQADLTLAPHKQIWKLQNQTLPISTPKISWFNASLRWATTHPLPMARFGLKGIAVNLVEPNDLPRLEEVPWLPWESMGFTDESPQVRVMLMTGCEQPPITTQKIWFLHRFWRSLKLVLRYWCVLKWLKLCWCSKCHRCCKASLLVKLVKVLTETTWTGSCSILHCFHGGKADKDNEWALENLDIALLRESKIILSLRFGADVWKLLPYLRFEAFFPTSIWNEYRSIVNRVTSNRCPRFSSGQIRNFYECKITEFTQSFDDLEEAGGKKNPWAGENLDITIVFNS